MAHALYEMALNPHIQDKVRKEIKEFHAKNNGNFTYEEVKKMKYLDKVFKGIFFQTYFNKMYKKCKIFYTLLLIFYIFYIYFCK